MATGVFRTVRDVVASLIQTGRQAGQVDWPTRQLISQLGCGPKCGTRRGCRAGRHVQRRRYTGSAAAIGWQPPPKPKLIPVIVGYRPATDRCTAQRPQVLFDVIRRTTVAARPDNDPPPSSIFDTVLKSDVPLTTDLLAPSQSLPSPVLLPSTTQQPTSAEVTSPTTTAAARQRTPSPWLFCLPQTSSSPPQSLPLASSPASHPSSATNTVSYFRVNDPEEDVEGDSQSRNDRLVSCSRNMKASTSVHTDISFRSPVSIASVDSQPNLSSFNDSNITDYCINNLFNNIYSPSDHTTGEQVSSTVSTQNPTLKRKFSCYFPCFWICNIRGGLTSKLDEVTEILLANNVDAAVLVETWLHWGIHDDLICIPGYHAFRKDRNDGRAGGGILIYVRDGLPFQLLPQLDNSDLEVMWLLFRRPLMPREISHILIGAVYHPPSAHNGRMLDHLISTMDNVSRQHPYTGYILLGDFNQLPEGQLRTYPLKQTVTGPTRNSATLDKIFTNIANWYCSPVILPAVTKSDHNTVLFTPNDSPKRPKRQTLYYYRRTSDSSRKALLCNHLKHLNWTPLFRLENCELMVSYFYSVVISLLDLYLPIIRYTKSSTDKPWVTSQFREVVKCRQKAFLEGNSAKYHRLRNRTQRMAAKLRKSYFTSRVQQLHSCNPRQWWSKTRRILKTNDPNPLANLDHQGPPEQLAECINNFFVNVSSHLPKVNPDILANLDDDYNQDFIVDPSEVENRLVHINIHKAQGPDGLPNWLLRDFAPYLCQPLAAIFNASIREGYVPPIWKSAEVIPVPKVSKPRSIQTDLRPISLLPCPAKILESILGERILPTLEPQFDSNQFGCRRGRSTTHALVATLHAWQSTLDQGGAVRAVLVDFKKAFDLVNHNLLLHKLLLSGVPHCLIRWFFSYLQHRCQRLRIGNKHSDWKQLNGAMPQGSWLGPLSFLVLIDDLNPDCLVHKYVDDTTLTELLKDRTKPSNMQYFFQQLLSWADSNDMVVNFSKTKEIVMGPSSAISHLPLISVTSHQIERVTETKLLGIHLDCNLSWHPHVEAITSKATQRLYFLKQLKRAGLPHSQLLHFYITVIRPVLEYAVPVWHHLITKTQADNIEAIQKRAIRIIFSLTNDVPYTSALYVANIPTLADRREQLSRKFFNSLLHPSSCLHSLLPPPRDPELLARLRAPSKFPRTATRTKKYQPFLSHALSNYQT